MIALVYSNELAS